MPIFNLIQLFFNSYVRIVRFVFISFVILVICLRSSRWSISVSVGNFFLFIPQIDQSTNCHFLYPSCQELVISLVIHVRQEILTLTLQHTATGVLLCPACTINHRNAVEGSTYTSTVT